MTDVKSTIGQYKLGRLEYLEKLYKKLDIEFNWNVMKNLSKKDIAKEVRVCYAKLGKGGFTQKPTMINPRGIVIN